MDASFQSKTLEGCLKDSDWGTGSSGLMFWPQFKAFRLEETRRRSRPALTMSAVKHGGGNTMLWGCFQLQGLEVLWGLRELNNAKYRDIYNKRTAAGPKVRLPAGQWPPKLNWSPDWTQSRPETGSTNEPNQAETNLQKNKSQKILWSRQCKNCCAKHPKQTDYKKSCFCIYWLDSRVASGWTVPLGLLHL